VKSGPRGKSPVPTSLAPAAIEGFKEGTRGASQPSSTGGARQVQVAGYQRQRGSSQGRTQGQERLNREEDTTKNLFVGNLPHGCTEDDLGDLFSKFGRVLRVRIYHRQGPDQDTVPNFGEVVFEDAASVEKALSAEPILLYGNHRLNIGERKTRVAGDREKPGPCSFNMDRGGSDHPSIMSINKNDSRPVSVYRHTPVFRHRSPEWPQEVSQEVNSIWEYEDEKEPKRKGRMPTQGKREKNVVNVTSAENISGSFGDLDIDSIIEKIDGASDMAEPQKKQKSKAKKTKKKEKKGSMDKNIPLNALLYEDKNPHQDDENEKSKDDEKQESIESLSLTLISTKDEANIQPIKGQNDENPCKDIKGTIERKNETYLVKSDSENENHIKLLKTMRLQLREKKMEFDAHMNEVTDMIGRQASSMTGYISEIEKNENQINLNQKEIERLDDEVKTFKKA